MKLLNKLKGFYSLVKQNPEEDYVVVVNDDLVRVSHPWWGIKEVRWVDLQEVLLVNTNKGPWFPDVWLTLVGSKGTCKIPLGAHGYEQVYKIVSNYQNFNFENVIESMTCTDKATFILWKNYKI